MFQNILRKNKFPKKLFKKNFYVSKRICFGRVLVNEMQKKVAKLSTGGNFFFPNKILVTFEKDTVAPSRMAKFDFCPKRCAVFKVCKNQRMKKNLKRT